MATSKNGTNTLPETRQLKRSVTTDSNNQMMSFILPYMTRRGGALPPSLPDYTYNGFNAPRDILLLSTVKHEDQWANANAKAVAKVATKGYEVDSEIPIRRKYAKQWLSEAGAGMGIYGFIPFIAASLSSYLLTGVSFVEIERASPARGSKVINVHHLNPLRCRLTGDSRRPVHYLNDEGKVKSLEWWQVMIISDILDPTSGQYGCFQGAAARAYNTIRKLSNLENFLDEKISGRRPLTVNFIGGVTKRAIDDMLSSAANEADKKGLRSYGGAALVPVMSDQPVTNVSIDIAGLPDITDVERERNRADLIYANAIGIDVQDINPALLGRQGNGSTGNQSSILNDKQSGMGLAKYTKELVNNLNNLALDDSTTFSFIENDLRDQAAAANITKTRTETRKIMIEMGEITPEQSKNLAVDSNDLPPEFVDKDATGADKLRDDQKPDTDEERAVRAARPKLAEAEPKKPDEAKKQPEVKKDHNDVWGDIYH